MPHCILVFYWVSQTEELMMRYTTVCLLLLAFVPFCAVFAQGQQGENARPEFKLREFDPQATLAHL